MIKKHRKVCIIIILQYFFEKVGKLWNMIFIEFLELRNLLIT